MRTLTVIPGLTLHLSCLNLLGGCSSSSSQCENWLHLEALNKQEWLALGFEILDVVMFGKKKEKFKTKNSKFEIFELYGLKFMATCLTFEANFCL